MAEIIKNKILRATSIIINDLSAIISAVMMLHTGRHNKSLLLIGMFFFWVTAPFMAFFYLFTRSVNWPEAISKKLYWLIIINAIISVIVYSGIIIPNGVKPAAAFLIMPVISWITIVVFVVINKKSLQSS